MIDVDQVISVSEGVGVAQVCASITEGFIDRELEAVISLSAIELQNEATQCE